MPTSDKNISTEHQQSGDGARPGDTLDRDRTPTTAPDATDPNKGSPAKGAHQFGDDGAKAES